MDAKQAWQSFANSARHRFQGSGHLATLVRDQRRHQCGDAEAGVGLSDGAKRFRVGSIVKHDAAAAIHLHIDEPRRQQAIKPHGARPNVGNNARDHAAVDAHGCAMQNLGACEHA